MTSTDFPTPRTDAKVQEFENYVATFEDFIAHARQLERELDGVTKKLSVAQEWSDSKSEIIESLRFDLSEANLRLTIANDDAAGWEMLFDKAHAQKKGWQEVAEELKKYASYTSFDNMAQYTATMEKFRKLKEASK